MGFSELQKGGIEPDFVANEESPTPQAGASGQGIDQGGRKKSITAVGENDDKGRNQPPNMLRGEQSRNEDSDRDKRKKRTEKTINLFEGIHIRSRALAFLNFWTRTGNSSLDRLTPGHDAENKTERDILNKALRPSPITSDAKEYLVDVAQGAIRLGISPNQVLPSDLLGIDPLGDSREAPNSEIFQDSSQLSKHEREVASQHLRELELGLLNHRRSNISKLTGEKSIKAERDACDKWGEAIEKKYSKVVRLHS